MSVGDFKTNASYAGMSEVDVPAPFSRTLFDLLSEIATRHPDAVAAIDVRRSVTFAQLYARARCVAAFFRELGCRRGHRIALLLDNRIEWLEICFAASAVGATLVPISTFVKAPELAFLLEDSRADVLAMIDRVGNQNFQASIAALVPNIAQFEGCEIVSSRFPALRRIISLGNIRPQGAIAYPSAAELPARNDLPPGERASPVDDALILYTSGSASYPKAVRLAHYAIIENGFNIGERQGLRAEDRILLAPPLFWSYGSANALPAAMTHAATLILQSHFEAGEALDLIERHKCTAIYTLPGMTAALLSHPSFKPERTRSLRTGLTIGSPQDVLAAALKLGAAEICNIYGATETCGNCCVTDHRMSLEERARCQGPPLPGVSLRIIDLETGAVLPAQTEGAVEVKGYITSGYVGASATHNATAFTGDGYFRMGDIGMLTEEGQFLFVSRGDEMIKRAGINVSPAEIEEILLRHPQIAQAGVVGTPDVERGARITAFIVPINGAAPEPSELDRYCRAIASHYKVPDQFVIRSSLPTTPTGKLLRRDLRSLAIAAQQDR